MARDINLIEKDIEKLQQDVQEISDHLETAYENYTQILGDTLKQQLVFSVYQICTQEYPKGFLSLSLSQQQNLQQKIRELAKTATENLKLGGDLLQMMNLEEENDDGEDELEEEASSPNIFSEQWETFSEGQPIEQAASNEEEFNSEQETSQSQESRLTQSSEETSSVGQESTPDNLMAWSNLQEEAMAMILATVSSQANTLLQNMGILPQELPQEMIEAALQTEGAGSISNRAPGVLHLMLEVERKNKDQQSRNENNNNEVMQLAVVRLRVGELEFAAPSLNAKRREIRTTQQQLQKLQEQYNRLTNERAIAQAELAWRSSWHED